jgi:hypothetical protein
MADDRRLGAQTIFLISRKAQSITSDEFYGVLVPRRQARNLWPDLARQSLAYLRDVTFIAAAPSGVIRVASAKGYVGLCRATLERRDAGAARTCNLH